MTDVNLSSGSKVNYNILPRTLQFWSYQDYSSAMQDKKLVDTEAQNEKMAMGSGFAGRDVVEIKKCMEKAQELTKKTNVHYYEEISDNDEEVKAFEESNDMWKEKTLKIDEDIKKNLDRTNSRLRNRDALDLVIQVPPVVNNLVKPPDKSVQCVPALGLGRGRGSNKPSGQCVLGPVNNGQMDQGRIDLTTKSCTSNKANSDGPADNAFLPSPIQNAMGPISNDSIDKTFSKGRGVPIRARTLASKSSSIENERQFSLSNQRQVHDEDTEFCEMSVRRWNKNTTGKLCFDQFSDEPMSRCSSKNNNEAMGIMWNSIGLSRAKITDDLYEEFGLPH